MAAAAASTFMGVRMNFAERIRFDQMPDFTEYSGVFHHLRAQRFILFGNRLEKCGSIAEKLSGKLVMGWHGIILS